MPHYLVSLHSPDASKYTGALGIVDSLSGFKYLQVDDGSPLVQKHQLRGLSVLDDTVYVTTQASLRIYKIQSGSEKPVFKLVKEIVKEEWVTGQWGKQGDLLPVHASKYHDRVYVGCNSLSSIDEFTLDGVFIVRRFLWEISPEVFALPETVKGGFRFGHIRSINESSNGRIVITSALIGGEDKGAVIDLTDGSVLIDDLYKPHGGIFLDDRYIIPDVEHAKLHAFCNVFGGDAGSIAPDWIVSPAITDKKYADSVQRIRGVAATDEQIVCGVFHQGGRKDTQVPPRLVVFNTESGKQINEIYLPDIEGFPQSRIFSITPLAISLNCPDDSFDFYVNGESFPVVSHLSENSVENLSREVNSLDAFGNVKENVVSVMVDKVSLFYRRQAHFFLSVDKHLRKKKNFLALDEVSFTLHQGETVGIIGRNGSGKSTLSRLICGALVPDEGHVRAHGRVQLLSLGVGFSNDLTGRENAFISGTLMGLSRKEVTELLPDIESFAELGEFMDEPVRTYSSGMRSRLGFAIATAVNPDVLILDEVMSTGDQSFRKRAQERMDAMRESVKTVIIVSHSPAQVKKMCSRALWFEKGRLMMDGHAKSVVPEYERFCQNPDKWLERHETNEEQSVRDE